MALYQSKSVAAKASLTESDAAGDAIDVIGEFIVPAALTTGDIIEMVGVPMYHVLTNITVLSGVVDSNGTPTLTYDLGFMSGNYGDVNTGGRTSGNEFQAASTAPLRAGGLATPLTTNLNMVNQVASAAANRGIGLKITAPAATLVVGAKIRVRVSYVSDPGFLS